jgi:signal transduction histidine kinase
MNKDQNTKEELKTVRSSAQEVMTSLRETLWTLHNKTITNHDLIDKLKVYIKKHLLIDHRISDNSIHEYVLSNDVVLALYRCVQEIINNANKHSKAKSANILFSSSENLKFSFRISDDGIGFEEKEKEESYGLRNLRSRLKEINAELVISTKENEGTTITINYF